MKKCMLAYQQKVVPKSLHILFCYEISCVAFPRVLDIYLPIMRKNPSKPYSIFDSRNNIDLLGE